MPRYCVSADRIYDRQQHDQASDVHQTVLHFGGLGHGASDGEDEADALEREDHGAVELEELGRREVVERACLGEMRIGGCVVDEGQDEEGEGYRAHDGEVGEELDVRNEYDWDNEDEADETTEAITGTEGGDTEAATHLLEESAGHCDVAYAGPYLEEDKEAFDVRLGLLPKHPHHELLVAAPRVVDPISHLHHPVQNINGNAAYHKISRY